MPDRRANSVPSEKDVVLAAREACTSFANCAPSYFNFECRDTWLGWENWLTVDIARRLNSRSVFPFYSYPRQNLRLDISVGLPVKIAVEIKTNYIDNDEASDPHRLMSSRVVKDAEKIRQLHRSIKKVILVSTFFESTDGLRAYSKCVKKDLAERFGAFRCSWHDCSAGGGHNLLLVLSR